MRTLRDYVCDAGHVSERFLTSEIGTIECPICGLPAKKTLGMGTIKLDGTDPAFPSAYDHWANIRERRHRQSIAKK